MAVRSFLVFLLLLFACFLFRIIFLLLHFDFKAEEMLQSIFAGLRLDSQFCAGFAGFYFLFGSYHRYSKVIFIFISLLVVLPEFIFFVFFNIYKTKINSNLFLFEDESIYSLFNTALKENYGIFSSFLIACLIFFSLIKLHFKIKQISFKNKFLNVFLCFGFVFLMMITINQRFGFKAKNIQNLMPELNHNTLKSSTFGHLNNFYKVVLAELKKTQIDFKNFNVGTPKQAACEFFNINPCEGKINLYDYIKHTKTDKKMIKPKKIYYIISESLSNWVMEERFKELFSDIHDFAKYKATYIPAIHNGSNTRDSIGSQFLGLYGGELDFLKNYNKIIPPQTSLSYFFKDFGYKSIFYFGGTRNWAGTEDLGDKIGFSEFFGENVMIKASKNIKNHSNIWGIYDNLLFDFISKTSKANTFNAILTTTNHPPYDLSFAKQTKFTIPFSEIEKLSTKYKNELATVYWYQKTLINWIEKTAKDEPDSLFIITGDHYGRYNIDDSFDLFTTSSVPVIFYYPKAKIYPTCKITNHLDISASIINLIAPSNYEYVSFGSPCFSLEEKEIKDENKIGYNIEYVNGKFTNGGERIQLAKALSWYLAYKGNVIE